MKNLAQKSKLALAFVSGALCVGLLQVTPLNASTPSLTGACASLENYSSWGWREQSGDSREYNGIGILNFDTKKAIAIVNSVTISAGGSPNYKEGEVENSDIFIESGPFSGSYKVRFDSATSNDYVIVVPTNGGATMLIMDSRNGASGFCQKI